MAELQEIEQQNNENMPESHALSTGAALEAARLAKGMTQQDVSNSLRYSVKQIDALEKDAFDLLPDAMITRGFIRSYARLLEIDAEPLLASYRQLTASESDKAISVQSSMRPVQLTKESQPWLKYILASILVTAKSAPPALPLKSVAACRPRCCSAARFMDCHSAWSVGAVRC